jgi:TolB-like protein
VLPFANFSDDSANEYFADGIQDDVLTDLAKISALKVISRTSVQSYRGQAHNVREIGSAPERCDGPRGQRVARGRARPH